MEADKIPNPLYESYKKANQEHVFRFWGELNKDERKFLLSQLSEYDPEALSSSFTESVNASSETTVSGLSPPKSDQVASVEFSRNEGLRRDAERWNSIGLEEVSNGRVAILLLAGGQGTRLGSSSPKGCYDFGLKSKKTPFMIQAERLSSVQSLSFERFGRKCVIPWYIMTSDKTHAETQKYFEDNEYFGISKKDVIFFKQEMIPAFDMEGKLLLESKYSLALSPNGNGGIYSSLLKMGILRDMEARGIKYVHIYCVDNILSRVADPVFIGFSSERKADVAVKVVRKTSPSETAGVFCLKNGIPTLIEYSELPKEYANMREKETNELVYNAANIASHVLSINFLKEACTKLSNSLPYHIAKKKIKHLDSNGIEVNPKTPNGIKLEKFIFDVFFKCQNFAVLTVERGLEFSPLKNGKGSTEDCPETCVKMYVNQCIKFLQDAKVDLIPDENNETYVELSPLVSYAGESLSHLSGMRMKTPVIMQKKL